MKLDGSPEVPGQYATLASHLGRIRSISRGQLMAILLVLLVAMLAIYFVEPRIETRVGAPADPARAILTPFLITNTGFFPFRDVHAQCVAGIAEFGASSAAAIDNSVLHVTSATAPSLRPGQQLAVTCSRGMEKVTGILQHADFDLNVCLKPYPLIDYISLVHFRYVGDRGVDGAMRWVEQPPRRGSIPWVTLQKQPGSTECKWAE